LLGRNAAGASNSGSHSNELCVPHLEGKLMLAYATSNCGKLAVVDEFKR
jgi:hypothetical protein